MIAKEIPSLTKEQRERLYYHGDYSFDEFQPLMRKNGYSEPTTISKKLVELYIKKNEQLEEEIYELLKKKAMNGKSNQLLYMLGMAPQTDNTDKILKYERSIQKSIYQNLIMLKKLQGSF